MRVTDDATQTRASRQADAETSWHSLAPSAEITQFADSAREQFASIFPLAARRENGNDTAVDLRSWSTLVDQGYTSIGLPEDLGGLGSLVDAVPVLEAAGAMLVPLPLTVSVAATHTLVAAGIGSEDSFTERSSLVVLPPGDGAWSAEVFDGRLISRLVAVREGAEGVFVESLELTGATDAPRRRDDIDPSRSWATVGSESTTPLARSVTGVTIDQLLSAARVCTAADLVGVAAESLARAIAHVLARSQFGRPIGSFQGVKFMLADAYVALERARSLTIGAAAAIGQDPFGDTATHLSMLAKATSAEIAVKAAGLRVQLMGAMGLTREADAHLFVRRAQQTSRYLGSSGDLYARVGYARFDGGTK